MTTTPQDQTRGDSSAYIEERQSASLSRNEVASLCMKAARGAGMSWGLAEEAGFAAAWLVQHGINGPRHLWEHLDQTQDRQWADLCPTVTSGLWKAPAECALCPIALGATLCDYAGLPEGIQTGASLKIGNLDHPVLLLPFLGVIATSFDMLLDIEWASGRACLYGGGDTFIQAATALDGQQLPITLSARAGKPQVAAGGKMPNISARTLTALNTLAMRTTVPSSESSRAGAGSTTTDND